jgi:hypothetical protein
VGLLLIGCARLSRSYIQIKNFLNSYRAGAHTNLVTLDISALFSAYKVIFTKNHGIKMKDVVMIR